MTISRFFPFQNNDPRSLFGHVRRTQNSVINYGFFFTTRKTNILLTFPTAHEQGECLPIVDLITASACVGITAGKWHG